MGDSRAGGLVKLRICVTILAIGLGCGSKSEKKSEPAKPTKPKIDPKDLPDGLAIVLSNGKEGAPAYDRAKLGAATKLTDADTKQLLARTKPLPTDPQDLQAFAIRPSSQPAPRTGETIATTFPPAP